ncbi:MAG: CPXCG motif-containing cysteine-rich protein [Verrucomicrobia bacterium]|nr:CPXCG motif-containing cysteine-rich protein [Verrucomicrobiota bacterium]
MFEVCLPGYGELPAEVDYDCEVCCRPLIISFREDEDGEVWAEGRSLED